MPYRLYSLKMSLFILLPLLLNGCGNDQLSSKQGNNTATADESVTMNDSQPAAPEPRTAEAGPATKTATTAGDSADGNVQQPETAQGDSNNVADADTGDTPEYQVECDADGSNCRVGMDTYIGWRMYRSQCTQCHGQDAQGTTIGPNLLDRLNQRVDYPRFVDVITNGYRGQMGVMPAWNENKAVMEHIPNLYMYLKARADGVLDAGRPQRLE
ncbi:MAG: cytochrome c [Gammaproteobacteria bacterium]|nr:cytochrome c [Gammaproteobacteria bacterium]